MRRKYPEDFKKKVVQAVIEGLPIKKASRFFDVERHTLQKWCRATQEGQQAYVKHCLSDQERQKAVALVESGESVAAVARAFNVTTGTIYNWLGKSNADSVVYSEQDISSEAEVKTTVSKPVNPKDLKIVNRGLKEENSFLKARVAYLEELMKLNNINIDSFKKKLDMKQSTESLNEEKEL